MSYFFIARIRISDPVEYKKYLDKAGEIFRRFKGTYIVLEDTPLILEGNDDSSRMVVIKFDNKRDFEDWYYSPDYQKILKFRLNAAECNSILAKSIE